MVSSTRWPSPSTTGTSTAAGTGGRSSPPAPHRRSIGLLGMPAVRRRSRPAASAARPASRVSGRQFAQGKELAAAPDAQHALAADPFMNRQGDQFVIGGAVDPRLDAEVLRRAGADQDVGRWLTGEQSCDTRIGCSGPAVTTSSILVRKDSTCCRPSPVQSSSTATNGASSTSIRPRSAGVCSHQLPSSSRRSTLENRQTSSFRLIGRAPIQPRAVALDQERQVAAVGRHPRGLGRRTRSVQAART